MYMVFSSPTQVAQLCIVLLMLPPQLGSPPLATSSPQKWQHLAQHLYLTDCEQHRIYIKRKMCHLGRQLERLPAYPKLLNGTITLHNAGPMPAHVAQGHPLKGRHRARRQPCCTDSRVLYCTMACWQCAPCWQRLRITSECGRPQ